MADYVLTMGRVRETGPADAGAGNGLEAVAVLAAVADAAGRRPDTLPESSTPSVYPYRTRKGVRWLFRFRDSRGKPSTRPGFPSEAAAAARTPSRSA